MMPSVEMSWKINGVVGIEHGGQRQAKVEGGEICLDGCLEIVKRKGSQREKDWKTRKLAWVGALWGRA